MTEDRVLELTTGRFRDVKRLLVLCRTAPQVASLRRAVAKAGGRVGLDIATPLSFALAAAPKRIEPPSAGEPEAEPSSDLLTRIGDRPGLRAAAESWVRAVRLARVAGHAVAATPRLSALTELADAGWAADEAEAALSYVLQTDPKDLPAHSRFDVVVSLGFDTVEGLGPERPWEQALLRRLGAVPLHTAGPAADSPLPMVRVPDTTAEARLAVRLGLAVRKDESCLVLVPDDATADRFRAAAARNGLRVGHDQTSAIARHAICRLVRQVAEWVEAGPSGLIAVDALGDVFGDDLFRASDLAVEAARIAVSTRAAEKDENGCNADATSERYLMRHVLRAALRATSAGRCTAAEWSRRLHVVGSATSSAEKEDTRRGALVLAGWTQALTSAITTGTFAGVSSTLAGLARTQHHDRVVLAVLAALRDVGTVAVTRKAVDEALAGTVASEDVFEGIDCLLVEDWDGRSVDRLLILGAHDKGLGARPGPDPLLNDAELMALGQLDGGQQRALRIATARAAAGRAGTILAIAATTDATGRAVCVPPDLAVDLAAGGAQLSAMGLKAEDVAVDSLGLHVDGLPERQRALALERGSVVTSPPEGGNPADRHAHLALQANAEWVRVGRSAAHRVSTPSSGATLADIAPAWGRALPEALRPYFGAVGSVPELVAGPWSVSSKFEPLTNSLYRFFTEAVLYAKPLDDLDADVGAADLGTLVHKVLEDPAFTEPSLWFPADKADTALAHALDVHLPAAFRKRQDERAPTAPLAASAAGLAGRWGVHMRRVFAPGRVRVRGAAERAELVKEFEKQAVALPCLGEVAGALGALPTPGGKDVRTLRSQLLHAIRTGSALPDEGAILANKHFKKHLGLVAALFHACRQVIASGAGEQLQALHSELERPTAPVSKLWSELGFGRDDCELPLRHVVLTLGGQTIALTGSIDRVARVELDAGPVLTVLDYKTGRAVSRPALEASLRTLQRPQLVIYALALEAATASEPARTFLGATRVDAVGYDYIKAKKGLMDDFVLSATDKEAAQGALDRLVGMALAGDFWLVPLADDPEKGGGSWGYPKGRLSLRAVARFQAPPPIDDCEESKQEHS